MFGFLKYRGFAIKLVGCFHTIIIFLFLSFRIIKHVQASSNTSNIVTLILGGASLALLALYSWSRDSKIKNLGIYGKSKCSFRFNLGLGFSLLSWFTFVVINLLSIFLDSISSFIWYSYIGIIVSFVFSGMAMSSFNNLEKRLI